jgi:hypothetical protein
MERKKVTLDEWVIFAGDDETKAGLTAAISWLLGSRVMNVL